MMMLVYLTRRKEEGAKQHQNTKAVSQASSLKATLSQSEPVT